MNILSDFHHADLWWSLQLLANRLGATLYRPYGMQWFDEGYYKLYGNLRAKDPDRWIAKQYLEDTIFQRNPAMYRGEGWAIGRETYNGCNEYPFFRTLTLDQCKVVDGGIDIIICSVHENESYLAKLKEFWPNAKFIRQVGNDLDTIINEDLYPNLLASAIAPFKAFKGHKYLYRQEFDLNLFKPESATHFNNIYSFQNDLEQFEETWDIWTDLKHKLRDYKFQSFGVGCEQGKIYPKRDYIQKMLEATFILQSKGPWEGYGHTLHNAICLGRPVIIKYGDYKDKLGGSLLIKEETYLEMDDPELPDKIRYYSEPIRYQEMSRKCRKTFTENVDFDREGEALKEFFDNLL